MEDEELGIEENVDTPNENSKKGVGCVIGALVLVAAIVVVILMMKKGYDEKLQEQREFYQSSSQEIQVS